MCSDSHYILNLKLLVSLNSVIAVQLPMSRSIFDHLTPKSILCRMPRSWNRLTEMSSVLIQTYTFSQGTQLLLNPTKWVQIPFSFYLYLLLLVMHICDVFYFPIILLSGGFEEYINCVCKTESGNKICARDE